MSDPLRLIKIENEILKEGVMPIWMNLNSERFEYLDFFTQFNDLIKMWETHIKRNASINGILKNSEFNSIVRDEKSIKEKEEELFKEIMSSNFKRIDEKIREEYSEILRELYFTLRHEAKFLKSLNLQKLDTERVQLIKINQALVPAKVF